MNRREIEMVRDLIAEGLTDDQIAVHLAECAADDAEAADFEERAYGIDDRSRDGWTSGQIEFHDRLDMGRNEAGEWLGFM